MNRRVIVTSEFRCSEDFRVQFLQLVFFIALTFHFPTRRRYISFKDRTKNHLCTPSVCPDDAMKIHIKTMFAQQKSMPFYYPLKLECECLEKKTIETSIIPTRRGTEKNRNGVSDCLSEFPHTTTCYNSWHDYVIHELKMEPNYL